MTQNKEDVIVSAPDASTDLAHWVAQLDAAQKLAYADYVEDRLQVIDHILGIVTAAKRDGTLLPEKHVSYDAG